MNKNSTTTTTIPSGKQLLDKVEQEGPPAVYTKLRQRVHEQLLRDRQELWLRNRVIMYIKRREIAAAKRIAQELRETGYHAYVRSPMAHYWWRPVIEIWVENHISKTRN